MIKKALLLTTLAGLMLTGCKDFDCCMSSVIIVTPTSVTLEPANGNLADVYVASNLPWAVTAKPDWITVYDMTGIAGTTPVTIIADMNYTGKERSGVVTFMAANGNLTKLNVTQTDDASAPAAIAVTGITVTPATVTIEVGSTTTLLADVAPLYATNRGVTWSSSNTSMATVDANGVVTGVSRGDVIITATAADGSGITATASVTVIPNHYATMTTTASSVYFDAYGIWGGGTIEINWGDGSAPETFTLPDNPAHTYTDMLGSHTITIYELAGWGITWMYCSNMDLTSLDVSRLIMLQSLSCGYNQLTTLNVSGCTLMERLYCDDNQLTELDVSGLTMLKEFGCGINLIRKLDVSGCTALEWLGCDRNNLDELTVAGLANLYYIACDNNQLSELNVSGLTALQTLYCQVNQLSQINVSGFAFLELLHCGYNQLTELNISGCNAMAWLDCYENLLGTPVLDALLGALPDRTSTTIGYALISRNPGMSTPAVKGAAIAKNWDVIE